MIVTQNEKPLDALARKMTITRSLKLKLILEKEDPFQVEPFFKTHPKYNDNKI